MKAEPLASVCHNGGLMCFYNSFVLNRRTVFRLNFYAMNLPQRKYTNSY